MVYVVPGGTENERDFVFLDDVLGPEDVFELRTGMRLIDVLIDPEPLCGDEQALIDAVTQAEIQPARVVNDDVATVSVAVPDADMWDAVQASIVAAVAGVRKIDPSVVCVHDLTKLS